MKIEGVGPRPVRSILAAFHLYREYIVRNVQLRTRQDEITKCKIFKMGISHEMQGF
jgi:hypothetical protein